MSGPLCFTNADVKTKWPGSLRPFALQVLKSRSAISLR
jgi:hypothetical protein